MKNLLEVKKDMGKREVGTLMKNIAKVIEKIEDITLIESALESSICKLNEFTVEDLGDNEYDINFMLNKVYSGKFTNTELKKMDENYSKLVKVDILSISIEKRRNKYIIESYAWVTFEDFYGFEMSRDCLIKRLEVEIDNKFMTVSKANMLSEIKELTYDRLREFLIEEGLGDVVYSEEFLANIKCKLQKHIEDTNLSNDTMCYSVREAWDSFVKKYSLTNLAYDMGFESSDVERNFDLVNFCDKEMSKIKSKFSCYMENVDKEIDENNLELLKELSYFYSLTALKRHALNSNVLGIERVKNETIPKILEGKFDHSFYVKNANRGLEMLRKIEG